VAAARADRDARPLDAPQCAPRLALRRAQKDAAFTRAGAPRMSVASNAAAIGGARATATTAASALAPVLQVEHLSMRFGGLVALNDLSFTAPPPELPPLLQP